MRGPYHRSGARIDAALDFPPALMRLRSEVQLVNLEEDSPVDRLLSIGSEGHDLGPAFAAARQATLRLGLPWPADPALVPVPGPPEDEADGSEGSEEAIEVEVCFVILMPDYVSEHVVMPIQVPMSETALLAQLDTFRNEYGKSLFPTLIPIHPQTDPRWGLIAARPAWPCERVIVCLDLTLVDGRVLSCATQSAVDRHMLLNSAGLSGAADVAVYAGDRHSPILSGNEVFLQEGECVTFVWQGEEPETGLSLRQMLRTHLGWAPGPAFPQEPTGDRFCLAAEGICCDFTLFSDRAASYRADIAARFHFSVNHLVIQPAKPCQTDVALYGRQCRTVLAVGESWRRDDDEVGLLDCRPIFEGWRRVRTDERWLDVGALRRSLETTAPFGFVVKLSNCPRHWNWLWLEPGQVVVVTYVRAPSLRSVVPDGDDNIHHDLPRDDGHARDDARGASHEDNEEGQGPRNSDDTRPNATPGRTIRHHVACNAPSGHDTGKLGRLIAMWPIGILLAACLPSILWITSAFPIILPDFGTIVCLAICAGKCPGCRLLAVVVGLSLMLRCEATTTDIVGPVSCGIGGGPTGSPDARVATPVCWPDGLCRESRPVPTPCGRRLPWAPSPTIGELDASLAVADDWCGLTLLQESVLRPDCNAYFEASTLLEVLWEHFHPPYKQAQVTLSLDSLVPGSHSGHGPATEWYSLDKGQCMLPMTDAMWNDLCRPVSLAALPGLPPCLKKPGRFWSWIQNGAVHVLPADTLMICFTSDGSFAPRSGEAGWGLVLSAITRDWPAPGCFLGGCSGRTSDIWDYGDPADAGPINAFASEVVGLFWAAVLCYKLQFPCDVQFRCDNQAALGIAAGDATGGVHAVIKACQGLHFGLRFRSGNGPSYEHVYGHSGDFANELADALADAGAFSQQPPSFGLDWCEWSRSGGSPFEWIPHFCWMRQQPWAAPEMSHGMLVWAPEEPRANLPPKTQLAPFLRALPATEVKGHSAPTATQLGLVTYNTLSIVDPGQGSGSSQDGLHGAVGRIALLDKSLFDHKIFLAGLQETRTPVGTFHSAHFTRYSSGCLERRALGVELWIGNYQGCPAHAAVVLHTDTTRIIVRLSILAAHWCVFVGHAPHRGHGTVVRKLWWQESARLCDRAGLDSTWIFCVDGNCNLGAYCSASVGGHHADPEDDVGLVSSFMFCSRDVELGSLPHSANALRDLAALLSSADPVHSLGVTTLRSLLPGVKCRYGGA